MAFSLRGFFGPSSEVERERDDEVVEKLVLRLESNSSFEDRRDALKALRAMAKNYRVTVATHGLHYYISILTNETDVKDLVGPTLEILTECLNPEDESFENDDFGNQYTLTLLHQNNFITAVFNILEASDFLVRRNVIQLMTILVRHSHREVQDAVINQPAAVSRIVDLLHDTREVIRNNAVLFLTELARGDSAIQKLLAYENAFQLLFEIIDQETADSIVVEDCLFVVLNLLKKNSSNQEFFREANLIQRLTELARMFLCPPEDSADFGSTEWPEQKTSNFIFILEIVRSLVSPENIHSGVHACQNSFMQCGMVDLLSRVLLSDLGVSIEVLIECNVTVAELIRGNYSNQDFFANSSLNDDEIHRSALLVLLMSMTADKLNFHVRTSAFYCFTSFLNDNPRGKTKTIDSLLPSDNPQPDDYTFGEHICRAILSPESVQVWFGACILMHCLIDSEDLKTQLLRVRLSTPGQEPASLLKHISRQLMVPGSRKLQIRCGLLMFLAGWLHKCSPAIDDFLSVDDNVLFLTTEMAGQGFYDVTESEHQLLQGLIAFVLAICVNGWEPDNPEKKNSFIQLLERRVGKERIAEALDGLSRSEFYIQAAQRPQPLAKNPQDLKLEYQFTKMVKSLESTLIKIFRPNGAVTTSASEAVVVSYKKLIKQQDEQIAALTQELKNLKTGDFNGTNQFPLTNGVATKTEDNSQLIENLKQELAAQTKKANELADAYIWVENAKTLNTQWQNEVETLRGWLKQWQEFNIQQVPEPHNAYCQQLLYENRSMEAQLNQGWAAFEKLTADYAAAIKNIEYYKSYTAELQQQIASGQQKINAEEAPKTQDNYQQLSKEHEDLLVLLAEQDAKLTSYKQRLRALGQPVSDDEAEA